MYCPKCGTENADDAIFCSKCGNKLVTVTSEEPTQTENKKAPDKETKSKMIGTLIGMAMGFVLFAVCFIIYNNDTSKFWGYNYRSPLTSHEVMVIIGGLGGLFSMVVGAVELYVLAKKEQGKQEPEKGD